MSIPSGASKTRPPRLAFLVWPVIITFTWVVAVFAWALTTWIVLASTSSSVAVDENRVLFPLWVLVAVTLVCGITLGAIPKTPWYERLVCWFVGSMTSTVCILGVYVGGMSASNDPNSDISAAVGITILAIPIAFALFCSLGVTIGIGIAVRGFWGRRNRTRHATSDESH